MWLKWLICVHVCMCVCVYYFSLLNQLTYSMSCIIIMKQLPQLHCIIVLW
jgi:hypothetical protein